MDRKSIEKIKKNVLGNFFYYDTVKSTNREALDSSDAPHKSLFLAKNQTAGRGRSGRCWEASEGGIYMTVLLKPQKMNEDISALTLAAGLAVSNAIPNSQIKWPNDIILDKKKVAGILLESKISGENGIIAVGIGINANNEKFSEDIRDKATSIFQVTEEKQNEAELVIKVYREFLAVYEKFLKGFAEIKEEYIKKCVTINREIAVITDKGKREMYAVGISDKGELLAEENGIVEAINCGDVSVRGMLGYI